MVYFGSYNKRSAVQDPQKIIDNYNYIFKVNTLSNNTLEIVDIIFINTYYECFNIDVIYNIFKECRIIPGMIIHYDINDVYFTHPNKGFNIPIKMYELFKITQYIYLDSLDEIKQSLIKKDKILSS